MKRLFLLPILSVILLTSSCKKEPNLQGLWVVKSVNVAGQEMTPNARWMRFNDDYTQQSGNGWYQHSIGTYQFNLENNELLINNSNGIIDQNEPFKITINDSVMTWKRTEEGQPIKVMLKKTKKLPRTYGDNLLGLWSLEKTKGNGSFFKNLADDNDYIFFRWDKRFVIKTKNGRHRGVYNVHGHKPEVELIPYNSKIERSFWNIKFEKDIMTLTLKNTDSIVIRKFKRTNEFPEN